MWAGTSSFQLSGEGGAELLSAEALGLPANLSADWLLSRQADSQAELGLFPDAEVPALNRAAARPMAGTTLTAADGHVQVIVRFTMPATDVSIHGYRVTYRRDGATRTVFIPYSTHACVTTMDLCPWIRPSP